jgi:hypothetical protein
LSASSSALPHTAPVARRGPVLAGAPLLVGFAFIMGIVMTVVCPTGREYAALSDKKRADAYSIAYLTVLTRADPTDMHLRVVYVRQLAQLGRWEEALQILDRAPGEAHDSVDTRALRLELLLASARAIPRGSPDREQAFRVVHIELAAHADAFPKARARDLAELALELEDPLLAASFYLIAADAGLPPGRPSSLADAGRWFRAGGDGQRAAESYQRAADEAAEPTQKTASRRPRRSPTTSCWSAGRRKRFVVVRGHTTRSCSVVASSRFRTAT